VNRSLKRTGLVSDGGPPRCRECGGHLAFRTDRLGRTMEQCVCGYRAYIERRDGKPAPAALPPVSEH
jgi:hypothetical protein